MNPFQNKYYQQSLSYLDSIRDKTKSHMHQPILSNNNHTPQYNFQPTSVQTTKQNNLNLSLNNISLGQTSPLTTNYSDKYKSYYMEGFGQDKSLQKKNLKYEGNSIQPYTRFSVNDLNANIQNNNRPNVLPHSPSLQSQKSLQRKRFFTVTSKSPQHSSSSSSMINQQPQQQSSSIISQQHSSSMISQQQSVTNQQNISAMIKIQQQKASKKDGYQFTAHRLSIAKTQNSNTPQQKSKQKRLFTQANNDYTRISNRNSGESLLMENKQNKKISLKRDIISPRYEEFQQQKKLSLESDEKTNIHSRQNIRHFSNLPYTNSLKQENDHVATFKKTDNFFYEGDSQILKIQKFPSEQLFLSKDNSRAQSVGDNTKVTKQKVNNQVQLNSALRSLKKQQIIPVESIDIPKQSQHTHQTRQQAQPSIPTAKPKSPNKSILIDNDIYQDMKISRIEQSTLTLQSKLHQIQKTLQTLLTTHQLQQQTISTLLTADQQQQKTINELKAKLQLQYTLSNTNRTTSNHHQIDPHQDFKKIKKELKIIKNNFELAFTSMTEQINRKLIKQQQIIKNLSEQIKTIASENIKLSHSIQQKSSKVLQLQKSMTSFMQQNQERIQNLVLLNDSYSSSANKRNRNNHSSFQYGLELKNMSAQDGGLSGRERDVMQILRVKVEGVEKEIKKMKVFHMEEKEVGLRSMNQLREIMGQFKIELNSLTTSSKQQSAMIPQLVSQNITQRLPLIISQVSQSINIKFFQQQQRLTGETQSLRESMMDMRKSLNEQLHEFGRGKLFNKLGQERGKGKDSLSLSLSSIRGESSIAQRQISSVKDKLSMLQQKIFSIDKRSTLIQQKTNSLNKWQQESRIKDIKNTGDIRQLYQLFKQYRLSECTNKSSTLINIQGVTSILSQSIKSMNETVDSLKVSIDGINMQIEQMVNASKIQTENIESINNQFQRVINKQIIPKFQQIHTHHLQTQKKLTQLSLEQKDQNNYLQSRSQGKYIGNRQNHQNALYGKDIHDSGLFNKVQEFINENINKFINNKVKLFSTKIITKNSPLIKLSLIQTNSSTSISSNLNQSDTQVDRKINRQNNYQINRQNNYQINRQSTYLVDRQNIYLVDESGYLMDWEGAYLMEMGLDGTRSKIRLTDKDIYFMQVNGINITHTQQYP